MGSLTVGGVASSTRYLKLGKMEGRTCNSGEDQDPGVKIVIASNVLEGSKGDSL